MMIMILGIIAIPAYPKDLGTFGETYPIIEQDLLELIQDRLKVLEINGSLQSLQNKLSEIAIKRIDRPKQVGKITKAIENHSWIFDPAIEVESNIKDLEGNIIVKAGTKGNPLDIISLTKTLVFYDADDKKQVTWVQGLDKKLEGKTKLILVNGSIFSQVKLFQKSIYFDQAGVLTKHFNIHHVPATVAQTELIDKEQGQLKCLKITEHKL